MEQLIQFNRHFARFVLTAGALSAIIGAASAQDAEPPAAGKPIARIEADGPLAYISSLAFSRDGLTLYAAGWDKRVHVWTRGDVGDGFEYRRGLAFRVPIGPGAHGNLNALAVSDDGNWLAVGGYGMAGGVSGFRDDGLIFPKAGMSDEMRREVGRIFVFETATRRVHVFEGHAGPVVELAFAPQTGNVPPVLVSAGREESGARPGASLRVWNIAQQAEAARLDRVPMPQFDVPTADWPWQPLPDPAGWKPGLAVWRTGARPRDLRVAIGWGDNDRPQQPRMGSLRIWDVANGTVAAAGTGPYALAAAASPARPNELLLGSGGELGVWNVPSTPTGALAVLNRARDYSPLARLQPQQLPRAAAMIPPRDNRSPVRAAVVVQTVRGDGRFDYELLFVDLSTRQVLGRPIPLATGANRQPTLAVSREGTLLAVAASNDNAVRIYDFADLQANNGRGRQTLSVEGRRVESVAFARSGDGRLGLVLTEAAADGDGPAGVPAPTEQSVFDIEGRKLSRDRAGWTAERADAGGWRVSIETPRAGDLSRPVVFVVSDPAGRTQRVELPSGHVPTAHAIVAAAAPAAIPVLADASHDRGEPTLALYDPRSGQPFRQLTAHVERIESLAFSADGGRLVSAGRDRSICVWAMDGLDASLGRIGGLRSVELSERDGRVIVEQDESGTLRPGDEFVSATAGDAGPPARVGFQTAREWYYEFARRRPGTTMSLAVRRGGRELIVERAVDQGVDERKPLFSLYVAADREAWIAWHRSGIYDSSGREAEGSLGWHFNTGEPESPARFATAEQFRQNRDERLLPALLETGSPPVDDEPANPRISLSIHPHDGGLLEHSDYEGFLLSRTSELTALVEVSDVSASLVAALEWSFAGGPFVEAASTDRVERLSWQIDLAESAWTPRRTHEIAVRLRLRQAGPQPGLSEARRASVYLLPQAPSIALKGPQSLLDAPQQLFSTRTQELDLHAVVTAGTNGQTYSVQLLHAGKVVHQADSPQGQPLEVRRKLPLTPGSNAVELRARNSDAPPVGLGVESTSQAWFIDYVPESEPPVIRFTRIAAVAGDYEPALTAVERDGQTVFDVDVPRVRITGRIEAPDVLTAAEIILAPDSDQPRPSPLAGFQPGRGKAFDFNQLVPLPPGRQTVRLRAATDQGKESASDLVFEYKPRLPQIAHTTLGISGQPAAGERVVEFPDEVDVPAQPPPNRLVLTAKLDLPADEHDYQGRVLLDGEPLPAEAVSIDRRERTLRASIPIDLDEARNPDTRRVQVVLSNVWRSERTPPLAVTFRHPPTITAVKVEPHAEMRIPRLTADIDSPDNRPVTALAVTVNGRRIDPSHVALPPAAENGRWPAAVTNVPLQQGDNRLELIATNSDGRSMAWTEQIAGVRPSTSPPEIELLNPAPGAGDEMAGSQLTVEFRVRSDAPPKQLDLVVSAGGLTRRFDLRGDVPPPDARGFSPVRKTIELDTGLNRLSIESDGGVRVPAEPLSLNVLPVPVELSVEKLVPRDQPDKAVIPTYAPGEVRFPPVASPHVTLHGRIGGLTSFDNVRVWVNGFLKSVPLDGGRFAIPVVLNQQANQLQVELQYRAVDESVRSVHHRITVDCTKPDQTQHLNLVVLAASPEASAEGLSDRVEESFKLGGDNAAFVYDGARISLDGDRATRRYVRAQLKHLCLKISRRRRDPWINDVLMFYYEGRAVPGNSGFVLLDRLNWDDPTRAAADPLTSEYLEDIVSATPGAHLVLLDVEGQSPGMLQAHVTWPPHLAVLGVVWQGDGPVPDDLQLVSAIGRVLPGEAPPAGTDEIRLGPLESNVRSNLARTAGPRSGSLAVDLRATEELRNLLIARLAPE